MTQEAQDSFAETGRGVDGGIDVDSRGFGRADDLAESIDERMKGRLFSAREGQRMRLRPAPGKQGLEQEQDKHDADNQRSEVNQEPASPPAATFEDCRIV